MDGSLEGPQRAAVADGPQSWAHSEGMAVVFRADQEIGRDLSAVDWMSTPLGPVEGWPQSLRTAVNILLSSRFSMWMAWGPELTFFCNAAYRRDTLGRKYPWALGRPASEVWAEIWDDIGPRIESVLSTGEATWDEALLLFLERSGYPEETYHTFSYSPLRDEDASVVGMLCVVSEDTDRVIGERRMATLRDLGSDPSVVRTERADAGLRRPPARQQPARPAVHPDLPVRRRRRRAPGRGQWNRAGHPAAPDDAARRRPGRVAGRRSRRGANRYSSSSTVALRRACRPATGPTAHPGTGRAAAAAGRCAESDSWWPP